MQKIKNTDVLGAAKFISGLRCVTGVRVLPYHNLAGSKYAALGEKNTQQKKVPTKGELAAVKAVFASVGVPVLDF
ncbi:MAG: hypothetical protein ACI4SC_04080 [Candidatus Neoclostridium sp.]